MRRALPFLAIGLCVVLALGWYFTWYAPAGDDVSDTNRQADTLDVESQELESKVSALRAVADRAPELTARAAELGARIPDDTSLDAFIIEANQIAQRNGITWLSVSPSPLQGGGPAGVGVIPFRAEVRGTYEQLRTYLEDLMEGDRLIVIDSVSIAAESSTAGDETAPTGLLQADFDGRMYTSALPDGYVDPAMRSEATGDAAASAGSTSNGTGVS